MSASEKTTVLARVASSTLPKRQVLKDLGVPKSTYYRWLTREQRCQGLENQPGGGLAPWNRLSQPEEQAVLTVARRAPELSCRQLAAWITDNQGFSVSESTVYRILRREGLVKSPKMQLKAGKEYHRKTTGPNQMWATDASYFKVIGWGYYYLVTVMDDFSRFILAHKLQRDMTSDSFIEVVQDAVDKTGMTEIPVQDRTRLLSDNGSGYVSRAFRDYLHRVGIRHILAAPFHPQSTLRMARCLRSSSSTCCIFMLSSAVSVRLFSERTTAHLVLTKSNRCLISRATPFTALSTSIRSVLDTTSKEGMGEELLGLPVHRVT